MGCRYSRMGGQTAHGLGFPLDAGSGGFVQTFGLEQGEGHFPVQQCVVAQ